MSIVATVNGKEITEADFNEMSKALQITWLTNCQTANQSGSRGQSDNHQTTQVMPANTVWMEYMMRI